MQIHRHQSYQMPISALAEYRCEGILLLQSQLSSLHGSSIIVCGLSALQCNLEILTQLRDDSDNVVSP